MAKLSASDREIGFKVKEIPVSQMTVRVNVKFTRIFKLRLHLGRMLIKLLAWLWTADVKVIAEE